MNKASNDNSDGLDNSANNANNAAKPEDAHKDRHADVDAAAPKIEALSAVTLVTADMATAVRFYQALGFALKFADPAFTSFFLGSSFLNLIAETAQPHQNHQSDQNNHTRRSGQSNQLMTGWGRVIIHVSDVDAMYRKAIAAGYAPLFAPSDAHWGERYFHILDPDGHEISFAKPLQRSH